MVGELQRHFEKIMAVPENEMVRVTATKQIKLELKMLLGISKMFEKIDIKELLQLYIKKGGSKEDIKQFLLR